MYHLRLTFIKPDESLQSAMARAAALIAKTEPLISESERASRKAFMMKNFLLKFASSKAKKQLSLNISLALRQGIILSYSDQLDICKMAEQDQKC